MSPSITSDDLNRISIPTIITKVPNETDVIDYSDEKSRLIKNNRNNLLNCSEGLLNRKTMKIQLTWKVSIIISLFLYFN